MTGSPRFRAPALKTTIAAVGWFGAAAEQDGIRLQPRKMQLLLYMAQGLYAAANDGRALMPSRFVAGSLGPADPNLYAVLEQGGEPEPPKEVDPKAEACLKLIYRKFAKLPVEQLDGFVESDGIFVEVRETAPGAEIPLDMMGDAYRRTFIEPAAQAAAGTAAPQRPAAFPEPDTSARPDEDERPELPEGVPKVMTGGKAVKRWAPKRRIY